MAAYYNEFDRKTAAWLRELIKAGLIADGEVDERSITDVQPSDLVGFTQCHFFAGIGGWSYALRLAGWPDDRAVWTGSCPCQPWSAAGKGAEADDPRHLWPAWFGLIRECRPYAVFGEQVAGKAGRAWLDAVQTDLESGGYAVGPAVIPACSVGTPNERRRLWLVADTPGERGWWRAELAPGTGEEARRPSADVRPVAWPGCRGRRSALAVSDVLSPSYGIPARVGRLRGYGNAINPWVAAEFIGAYLDVVGGGHVG